MLNTEKLKQHINELRKKHNKLQQEINRLVYTHQPDEQISDLKKEKLRIKDELTKLETKLSQFTFA